MKAPLPPDALNQCSPGPQPASQPGASSSVPYPACETLPEGVGNWRGEPPKVERAPDGSVRYLPTPE